MFTRAYHWTLCRAVWIQSVNAGKFWWESRFSRWPVCAAFWNVASCSLVEVDRRDDEGSRHLWNFGQFRRDHTAQHPTKQSSSGSFLTSCVTIICWRISKQQVNLDSSLKFMYYRNISCSHVWLTMSSFLPQLAPTAFYTLLAWNELVCVLVIKTCNLHLKQFI
jgi:hypothetical protein